MRKIIDEKNRQIKRNTIINRLAALFMILLGVGVLIIDKDITVFIFLTFFATPLFFCKRDLVN